MLKIIIAILLLGETAYVTRYIHYVSYEYFLPMVLSFALGALTGIFTALDALSERKELNNNEGA